MMSMPKQASPLGGELSSSPIVTMQVVHEKTCQGKVEDLGTAWHLNEEGHHRKELSLQFFSGDAAPDA